MDDTELTDQEIDSIVDSFNDLDDIIDAYDKDELQLESELFIEDAYELNEVLSRVARLKAKAKMRRTQIKREKRRKLVLKRKSTQAVLMKRARRLAIAAMKKKLAKKDPSKMSYADKVRVETLVARRKKAIDRIARKLVVKVKQIEQKRLVGRTTK